MKGLVLFNVDFCAWPLAILEQLAKRAPDLELVGVVVLDPSVTEQVSGFAAAPMSELHCLSRLEPGWFDQPDAAQTLERFERLLGRRSVTEIAVADRQLSPGWVSGGGVTETPLRRKVRDNDQWQAYLAGLLSFMQGLFERHDFDFVFGYPAQDAPSVTAGLLAERSGIPFLQPKAIGFLAKTCLVRDTRGMVPSFREAFEAARSEPARLAAHSEEARQALAVFRDRPAQPDYMNVANASTFERPRPRDLAALALRAVTGREPDSLRHPYPLARLRCEIQTWLRARRDQRHPAFRTLESLGHASFAYYPLHYEPEAGTMVAAPAVTDQLALIEGLAKAIPASWRLVVKEHLPMLGRRPRGFYERLAEMPKVHLLSPFESGFECIKRAELTAVITGTAGLEAVLLQRPAVFFGPSPIHLIERGWVLCESPGEMEQAIDRALHTPPADDETLIAFLAALFAQSVDLKADLVWGGTAKITPELVRTQEQISVRLADLILDAVSTDGRIQEADFAVSELDKQGAA